MKFFAAIATLWVSSSTAFASLPTPPAQWITEALRAQQEARSYADWEASEFNPEHLAHELENLSPEDRQGLCDQLLATQDEDLSVFTQWFSTDETRAALPCATQVDARLEEFIARSRLEVGALAAAENLTRLPVVAIQSRAKLGPSREISLATNPGPVLHRGDVPAMQVALTFDDGPHPSLTNRLVNILAKHDVQAGFFMVGKNTRRYPNVVKNAASYGHSMGAHSMTHSNLPKLALSRGKAEIFNSINVIVEVLGWSDPYFRFPYGSSNGNLKSAASRSDVAQFFWNVDTLDWKIKNPSKLYSYALKKIRSNRGGIVLFHDIQPQTIAIMPDLLDTLAAEGYQSAVFRSKKLTSPISY